MTKRDLSISYKSKRCDFPKDSWKNWPFEEKVRLFQEQIQGWVIDVARDIKQKQIAHADFAILSILLAYFENISKFINGYDGKYESKNHFIRGIKQIYPRKLQKKSIELLYDQARNGMYHVGLTGSKIKLDCSISCGFVYQNNRFTICPEIMVKEIQDHFDKYILELKDTGKRRLRRNFEKRGKFIWGT